MKPSIEIDTDKNRLPVERIHAYLITTYWAGNRSLETVQKTIDHSLNFGVYKNNEFVGFARVVTDYGVMAYLCDVFILPEYQHQGYGKMLMAHIMKDENLSSIRRWLLATKDAHGLYKQVGFTSLENPERWMHLFRTDL